MSFIFDLKNKQALTRMGAILSFAQAQGIEVRGDLSRLGAQALTPGEVAVPTNARGQWVGGRYDTYTCPHCQRPYVGLSVYRRHTRACQRRRLKGGSP